MCVVRLGLWLSDEGSLLNLGVNEGCAQIDDWVLDIKHISSLSYGMFSRNIMIK